LARQRGSYRFPSNDEFERALKERDLYSLRVCRHLLEGLENQNTKEPTDTSDYSIEHIMPQNENLRPEWRKMLGDNWNEIQIKWLNRLGNLTLTAYNSTYSDRPFEDKKTIKGGFADSSVRLNKYVRDQAVWTDAEISARTDTLAQRAVEFWSGLSVAQRLIDEADRREKREQAARRDVTLTGIESVQLDKQALKLATERALVAAARGELTPVIGQTYPLERAAQAHAAIEARTVFAKTLLTM